jgi:hypothetical protein
MKDKIDYAWKLSPLELEWLRVFEANHYGKGKSDGSERCREAYRADYRRKHSVERNGTAVSSETFQPSHGLTPELLFMAKEVEEKLPPRKKIA